MGTPGVASTARLQTCTGVIPTYNSISRPELTSAGTSFYNTLLQAVQILYNAHTKNIINSKSWANTSSHLLTSSKESTKSDSRGRYLKNATPLEIRWILPFCIHTDTFVRKRFHGCLPKNWEKREYMLWNFHIIISCVSTDTTYVRFRKWFKLLVCSKYNVKNWYEYVISRQHRSKESTYISETPRAFGIQCDVVTMANKRVLGLNRHGKFQGYLLTPSQQNTSTSGGFNDRCAVLLLLMDHQICCNS